MGFLKGKKTFLACAVMVVYAASAVALGEMDPTSAIGWVIEAATIIALRLGIQKLES